ncbi:hypothetical protein DFH08DRAFT_802516 [Mycena albidolilacea]|uniref:Uncharacterized protein n=1 Tax=Mycena albidolilacea TaxID=1033008 RepID=A0AAD7AEY1_9AGAR|nr:hypothetical protein DFH08DRAFT_802516 [Mycena albidolilacea]
MELRPRVTRPLAEALQQRGGSESAPPVYLAAPDSSSVRASLQPGEAYRTRITMEPTARASPWLEKRKRSQALSSVKSELLLPSFEGQGRRWTPATAFMRVRRGERGERVAPRLLGARPQLHAAVLAYGVRDEASWQQPIAPPPSLAAPTCSQPRRDRTPQRCSVPLSTLGVRIHLRRTDVGDNVAVRLALGGTHPLPEGGYLLWGSVYTFPCRLPTLLSTRWLQTARTGNVFTLTTPTPCDQKFGVQALQPVHPLHASFHNMLPPSMLPSLLFFLTTALTDNARTGCNKYLESRQVAALVLAQDSSSSTSRSAMPILYQFSRVEVWLVPPSPHHGVCWCKATRTGDTSTLRGYNEYDPCLQVASSCPLLLACLPPNALQLTRQTPPSSLVMLAVPPSAPTTPLVHVFKQIAHMPARSSGVHALNSLPSRSTDALDASPEEAGGLRTVIARRGGVMERRQEHVALEAPLLPPPRPNYGVHCPSRISKCDTGGTRVAWVEERVDTSAAGAVVFSGEYASLQDERAGGRMGDGRRENEVERAKGLEGGQWVQQWRDETAQLSSMGGELRPGAGAPWPRCCAPRRATPSLIGGATALASRRTRARPGASADIQSRRACAALVPDSLSRWSSCPQLAARTLRALSPHAARQRIRLLNEVVHAQHSCISMAKVEAPPRRTRTASGPCPVGKWMACVPGPVDPVRVLDSSLATHPRLPLPECAARTLAAHTLAQCRAGLEVPFVPNRQRVDLPLVHHLGAPRARLGHCSGLDALFSPSTFICDWDSGFTAFGNFKILEVRHRRDEGRGGTGTPAPQWPRCSQPARSPWRSRLGPTPTIRLRGRSHPCLALATVALPPPTTRIRRRSPPTRLTYGVHVCASGTRFVPALRPSSDYAPALPLALTRPTCGILARHWPPALPELDSFQLQAVSSGLVQVHARFAIDQARSLALGNPKRPIDSLPRSTATIDVSSSYTGLDGSQGTHLRRWRPKSSAATRSPWWGDRTAPRAPDSADK